MSAKVLLLNLPEKEQITRRYMCSYSAPNSLLPPLELISCAAVAREWNGATVQLIDAIAEKFDLQNVLDKISAFSPDVILSLTGFECFEQDIVSVQKIKQRFPHIKFILFGHFATQFPTETLTNSNADYVVLGEPEHIFSTLLNAITGKTEIANVQGIAKVENGRVTLQGGGSRIKNPNELPLPAVDLLPRGNKYYEPLMPKPFGMIQTLRGCPYSCHYCVKSYGSKLSQMTTERIMAEIKLWKQEFGVTAIRFIDDTFTINRQRVIELSKAIINEKLNIKWACLSRADNLDREMVEWMKKSGCMRIYFGLESGSQKMLDIYRKDINVKEALETLRLCREVGIETAGFFLGGHSAETESDFLETVKFACESGLNYVSYSPLTPYPGTPYYDTIKDEVNFSIFPYVNKWKDESIYNVFEQRKDRFYKSFYFRPLYWLDTVPSVVKNFKETAALGWSLLRYLFWDKQFIIGGLKGANDK